MGISMYDQGIDIFIPWSYIEMIYDMMYVVRADSRFAPNQWEQWIQSALYIHCVSIRGLGVTKSTANVKSYQFQEARCRNG